jgi:hypothetical protein
MITFLLSYNIGNSEKKYKLVYAENIIRAIDRLKVFYFFSQIENIENETITTEE